MKRIIVIIIVFLLTGLSGCINQSGNIQYDEDNLPDNWEMEYFGNLSYSDFDALVIIKDEVLENPKFLAYTAQKLNQALKIMYEFDPLQHHGWFVLTESDLKNYPQTYFPYEIFEYAKSLFSDKGLELEICYSPNDLDYVSPCIKLADSIIKKLQARKYPRNMYQLKGLLSQFMLLPALYIQAKEKRGIFKKFSFDLAKKDFEPTEWQIMEKVSQIRENWFYKINPVQRILLTVNHPLLRRIGTKFFAPSIPKSIAKKLEGNFYNEMLNLCLLFKRKLADV